MNNKLQKLAIVIIAMLGFVACGPTAEPEKERLYLTVAPLEIAFNDSKISDNTISVESNSAWSLTVSDQNVKTDITKGQAGKSSVTVLSMPYGDDYSVVIVTDASDDAGKQYTATVKLSRKEQAYLSVKPAKLTFDPTKTNTVSVESNNAWTLTVSDQAVQTDITEGKAGKSTVTIIDMPVGSGYSISFLSEGRDEQDKQLTATVGLSRPDVFVPETVYAETFGTGATTNSSAADYSGWNTTGTGAASVTYFFSWTSQIKNDNYGSSGRYAGASGGNYVRTFYDNGIGAIVVKDITLPSGWLDYTLSLGTEFTPTECTVALSADGKTVTPLAFIAGASYGYWGLVKIEFSLTAPAEKINIHIVPKNATAKYGINVDDVKLATNNRKGQNVELKTSVSYRWAEMPERIDDSNWAYDTYWTTTVKSKQQVRNFSYCYDTRRHNPIWVAYPLHECYREGGFGRTKPDPWHKAPELEQSEQSIIYPVESGSYFQYWTFSSLGSGSWTRGHLCRSADRGGADKEINIQTFVPTNVTPQTGTVFSKLWADSEALVSGGGSFTEQVCADTLYVVAGCYYQNDDRTEYDASNFGELSVHSKKCVVPTHQFKLMLRTRNGNSGKPIQECSAAELKAVGFWFETIIADDDERTLKDCAKSIEEIEQLTGITFYPDIPAETKSSYTLSDWGL